MVERDEDGFLERWSRRKRGELAPGAPETETAAELPQSGPQSGPQSRPQSEADTDAGDPEVIAKLPDIDNLTEETDFTAFLQDGVPEALRRKALRRLWRLNPVFANLDGLNDYDEDFSAGGIIAENIKTIYKVGKGYLDEDEDETEDETGEEGAAAVADSEPDSEAPDSDDPGDSAGISETTAALDSGPPAEGAVETKSKKPVRGSALARRWGGSPGQG